MAVLALRTRDKIAPGLGLLHEGHRRSISTVMDSESETIIAESESSQCGCNRHNLGRQA